MKHIFPILLLICGFAMAVHASEWAGVWYATKAPVPSDRESGTLHVTLTESGTIQGFLSYVHNGAAAYPILSGTWTLVKEGVYKLSFTVAGNEFKGTIRKNLMSGTWKNDSNPPYRYGGRFQLTLEQD